MLRRIFSKARSGGAAACATLEGRDEQTFFLASLLLPLAPQRVFHVDAFKRKTTARGAERGGELKEKVEHPWTSRSWRERPAECPPVGVHQSSYHRARENPAGSPCSCLLCSFLPSCHSDPASSSQPFLFPQKLSQYHGSPSKMDPTGSCCPGWRPPGLGDREGSFWPYKP